MTKVLKDDLIEDLDRMSQDEVEFCLIHKDGEIEKLELFITDGNYIYAKKNGNGEDGDIITIGLSRKQDA
jgi:hypothetical protein